MWLGMTGGYRSISPPLWLRPKGGGRRSSRGGRPPCHGRSSVRPGSGRSHERLRRVVLQYPHPDFLPVISGICISHGPGDDLHIVYSSSDMISGCLKFRLIMYFRFAGLQFSPANTRNLYKYERGNDEHRGNNNLNLCQEHLLENNLFARNQ